MVVDEAELVPIEEHLLACRQCAARSFLPVHGSLVSTAWPLGPLARLPRLVGALGLARLRGAQREKPAREARSEGRFTGGAAFGASYAWVRDNPLPCPFRANATFEAAAARARAAVKSTCSAARAHLATCTETSGIAHYLRGKGQNSV